MDRLPPFCPSCRNQALLLKLPGPWPARIPNGQAGHRSRFRLQSICRLIGMSLAMACFIRSGTARSNPISHHKVQIIAANGTLFIATAKGLYALDADTGGVKWVYPTEMPLGHSPTYHETVLFNADHPKRLYIAGFDHKIHAIDADPVLSSLPIDPTTGQRINNQLIWTFEAEQGFATNPLAVEFNNPADGKTHLYVYAGNRDSYEYALEDTGPSASLFWKYKTGGPVLFSTAISPNNQTIFFASNDSYVYALNATSGSFSLEIREAAGRRLSFVVARSSQEQSGPQGVCSCRGKS